MEEYTIPELQEKMELGSLNAEMLVDMYLECIEALDRQGPGLNAILETNPDALSIAKALDEERAAKGPRSPLHGVPVLLKDNFDTADKMTTTAGSLALEDSVASRDSFVAQRLRACGAVILGKTNLSEWANFRSKHSSSGWSSRGGQTRNPYALDRTPCGSSSGSAVAVAANLCAVAVGTETDGSVTRPAQVNAVVGLKPTVGLISRSGIIPIAHSQDTAGPMGRTVADVAILLGALTGLDPEDEATTTSAGKAHSNYAQFLNPNGLRGARLGVARNLFGFNPKVDQVMEEAIDALSRQGAEIVDPADIETARDVWEAEYEVLLYEFKAGINQYLAGLGPDARVRSLQDVIDFNEDHRDLVMPHFDQEHMLLAQEKGPLTDANYLQALETSRRLAREEGIDATIAKYELDAIVAPTGGPGWLIDLINGDHRDNSATTSAPAVAGYPHITVPAGAVSGLPVGISFIGAAFQEPTLLKLAYAYEQATQKRRPPEFLPTMNP